MAASKHQGTESTTNWPMSPSRALIVFVTVSLIYFLENLLSMGYGFVEYKNRSDALQAIKQLQVSGNLCLVIDNWFPTVCMECKLQR